MKISFRPISIDTSETPSGMRWITTKQKVKVLIPINATKEEIGKAIKKKYEELGIPLQSKENKKSVYNGGGSHWEKPNKEAIGSGYGTHTNGYGFYFSSSRSAAKGYRELLTAFTYNGIKVPASYDLNSEMVDMVELKKRDQSAFQDKLESARRAADFNKIEKELKGVPESERERFIKNNLSYSEKRLLIMEGIASGKAKQDLKNGQVTRARIPSNKYLLNKDKPIQEQSEYIKDACKKIAEYMNAKSKQRYSGEQGSAWSFYEKVSNDLGSMKKASDIFEKFGVKGITYWGGESDKQSFVIFNPNDIRIQKRNITGDAYDTAE